MASNYNNTSAIAYERFSASKKEAAPELRALPERKSHRRAVPYGKYCAVMACVFAVLLAIVFSYMQLAQLTNENDQLRTTISDLESEEKALSAKKEQVYNLSFVEDYAKNVLGMVKLDKSQIVYVELQKGDRMVLAETPESRGAMFWKDIVRSFSAVMEYLN
jgi:Septum formation initiator.